MRQGSMELLRRFFPVRNLQGIPAGFKQIIINNQHGKTTETNVS